MTPIKQWLEQADAAWATFAERTLADPYTVEWRPALDALVDLAVTLGLAPTEKAAVSVIHHYLQPAIGRARFGVVRDWPMEESADLWKERAHLAAADLEAKKWTVQ